MGAHRDTERLSAALRCGARTRQGKPCQAPALRGRLRCRMHGGKGSGASRGNAHAVKHGLYTRKERDARSKVARLAREAEALLAKLEIGT